MIVVHLVLIVITINLFFDITLQKQVMGIALSIGIFYIVRHIIDKFKL